MADILKGALSQATDGLQAQANGLQTHANNVASNITGNLQTQANGLQTQANEGLTNITGNLQTQANGLQTQANEGLTNITGNLQTQANEGLTNITGNLQAQANEGLTNITGNLQAQMPNIPGLGKGLAAVNAISSVADALTPVATKEDIIKEVALILEEKITKVLEEKITKALEEKVEVKVIQKLEEITKTVNDAIKTGANTTELNAESNANETKVGGRKSRKQKKNRITHKRQTNQKSFSRAFRRTQGRKRNSR